MVLVPSLWSSGLGLWSLKWKCHDTLIEQIVPQYLLWVQPCACHREYTEEPDIDPTDVVPHCDEGSRHQAIKILEWIGAEPLLQQRQIPRGGRGEVAQRMNRRQLEMPKEGFRQKAQLWKA